MDRIVESAGVGAGSGSGSGPGPGRRRRGKDLEAALLAAAWDELSEVGYAAFTLEGVAKRAHTSRPVIARRWAGREELMVAALHAESEASPVVVPDTGTLRGDVIAALMLANDARMRLGSIVIAQLGAYFEETATAPADLKPLVLGGSHRGFSVILDRAAARGEVDVAGLPPCVATLPFDLFRGELWMTRKPVPIATIEQIVDQVFLPLIAAYAERGGGFTR
jgi:AcrR family transcriptional regulator